jgi:aminoglycoside phosphotransferase (APT) family kinase protein
VDEIEIRLEAGNTSSVWRRGATIRRSTGPWTPTVHGLLRRLHDATVGSDLPEGRWREGAAAPEGGEVICHNDVAHYNTVFRAGRPVAFIDWDFAAPGPRAWDVAYAAYRFVPLVPDQGAVGLGTVLPVDRPGRLRRFCDAYGLADRGGLVDTVLDRVQAVCELIVGQAAKGDPFFRQHLAEGHLDG